MYALRRIVAYIIDMGLILTPITVLVGPLQGRLAAALPSFWQVYAGFFGWVLSMGVPVVVIGVLVGLTGRTPGKLLMFLRVQGRRGSKPGVPAGLLREVVKAICASMIFGALYALYGVITSRRSAAERSHRRAEELAQADARSPVAGGARGALLSHST